MRYDIANVKRLLSYLLPWKWRYITALIVCSIGDYGQNFLISLMLGKLIATAQLGQWESVFTVFLRFIVGIVIFLALQAAFRIAYDTIALKAVQSLRADLFHCLLYQPDALTAHSAENLSRMDDDVTYASGLYTKVMLRPLSLVMNLVLGAVTVFAIAWQSGLALVIVGVVMLSVNMLYVRLNRSRFDARQKSMSNMVTKMSDLLAGAETMRIYPHSRLLERFFNSCTELYQKSMGAFRMRTLQNTVGQVQAALMHVAGIGIGFFLYNADVISLDKIPLIWGVSEAIVMPLAGIGNYVAQIQEDFAGAARVAEVLDREQEQNSGTTDWDFEAPFLTMKGCSVRFSDKMIDYPDVTLAKGKRYAITGKSGSGKTTLLKILMGLQEYDGSAQLFGREVRNCSPVALRRVSAYLPQDCVLFHGTVQDNIAAMSSSVTAEKVRNSAVFANAHSFIMDTPNAYETKVGERGTAFSGGQRQRIGIARAFVKNAPLIMMDEPTSSLDEFAAREVISGLDRLLEGRTSIVITHDRKIMSKMDEMLDL